MENNGLLASKVVAAHPDIILVLDTDGVIVDYHAPDPSMLFIPPSSFMGRNFRALVPPAIAEKADPAFRQVIDTGEVRTITYHLPVGDGLQYFEGRFSPLPGRSGAIFIVRNITRQHETENKLQSLRDLHQLIVEFSSMLLQARVDDIDASINFTLRRLGEYARVDRVYIFDYVADTDLLNNTFEWCGEGITPEIANLQEIPYSMIPRWKEKFSAKEHVYIPLVTKIDEQYHVEKQILEPQGIQSLLTIPMFHGDSYTGFIGFDSVKAPRVWPDEHIALLRLAGEIIAGSIGRAKFMKEIIEARRQAENANKAKSEFLASMSHEIRTPMNAILGFSEILYNNTENPRDKNFLSGVLSSGRTLLYLINDILDLSKIEAGQLEIMKEPTKLADVFDEMGRIFSARIAEKGLEYRTTIAGDLPRVVLIDDVRLRQILFNLMGNAVKFTHAGHVELSASFCQSGTNPGAIDLELAVTDTGIGIPEASQGSVFDAFVQVETDNARRYGGTGLGLAITRRLVTMMNGSMTLVSEVGKGSTFTVTFRDILLTTNLPERKNIFDWFDKTITFEPATILVVDDVSFNRELARSYLHNFNFTVLEATNGQEGVALAKMHRPDLILMDLRMPKMSGYEAAELLRKTPETKHLPCIAFTASSMKHDEQSVKKYFDDHLLKPITRNELIDCLMKFLPHTLTDPDPVPESDTPGAVGVIPAHLQTDPVRLKQLAEDLAANILPPLDKLQIYLDAEVFHALEVTIARISQDYDLYAFDEVMKILHAAVAVYDFESFSKHIKKLDCHVYAIINHTSELPC